jgi:hypothetical protein
VAEVGAVDGDATITVASSSRGTRRLVGPLAWVVLEELALRAVAGNGALAVETSVRDLAGSLGVGKDAIAAALARLTELGLVRCQTRRAAGRYAGSAYVLEVDACRRAGLVLRTPSMSVTPCPVKPCPVEPCPVKPFTAQRDAVHPDAIAAARPEGEPAPSPPPAHDRGPLPQSLFDPSDASLSSPALPISPPPSSTASSPDPDPSPLFPPNPETDTSAPEVRQGGGQR